MQTKALACAVAMSVATCASAFADEKVSATDYRACLGDSLPIPPPGYAEKLVYVLSPPNTFGLDSHGNFVNFPNGKLEPMFYLTVARHVCKHDPAQHGITLTAKAFYEILQSNQAFRPEYIAVEQDGVTYRGNLILSRSTSNLTPALDPPTDRLPRSFLVAQRVDMPRFDASRALTVVYDGPRSSEYDGKTVIRVPSSDAPAPNFTGLWWNPAESGWGINFSHQANTVFATLFTYDLMGEPIWYVMSGGKKVAGDHTYVGELYRTTGSPFNANPFRPIGPGNVTRVGSMRVAFGGQTLEYDVDGVRVVKSIERQRTEVSGPSTCLSTVDINSLPLKDYDEYITHDGLWWNPSESGWGINLTQQKGVRETYFATLFTYDLQGKPTWYVMSDGIPYTNRVEGSLYRTKGPPFNAQPFTPLQPTQITKVGTLYLYYQSTTKQMIDRIGYQVAPFSIVFKNVELQQFDSPPTRCMTRRPYNWHCLTADCSRG